jgi:hypothetical protein
LGKRGGLTPPPLPSSVPHPLSSSSPHLLPDLTHSNTSLHPTPPASPTQQSSPQLLPFSLPVRQSPILGLPQTPLLHGIPFIRPFRASLRPHPVPALTLAAPFFSNSCRTSDGIKGDRLGMRRIHLGRTRNEPGDPCDPYPTIIASGEKTHPASQALDLAGSPDYATVGRGLTACGRSTVVCHRQLGDGTCLLNIAPRKLVVSADRSAMAHIVCRRLCFDCFCEHLSNGPGLPQTTRQRRSLYTPSDGSSSLPQTLQRYRSLFAQTL